MVLRWLLRSFSFGFLSADHDIHWKYTYVPSPYLIAWIIGLPGCSYLLLPKHNICGLTLDPRLAHTSSPRMLNSDMESHNLTEYSRVGMGSTNETNLIDGPWYARDNRPRFHARDPTLFEGPFSSLERGSNRLNPTVMCSWPTILVPLQSRLSHM